MANVLLVSSCHGYLHIPPPVQRREAEFFQKIIGELRVEPEYFMVGYYGKGFPLFLRVSSCHSRDWFGEQRVRETIYRLSM